MSSSIPPPGASGDSEPAPPPTLPGVALWSDSDPPPTPAGAQIAFSGLVASPTDRAMPTIGHIGRYALKYQLGEGGLGTVFAAHDPLLSRLIAVKTLNVKVPDAERESFNTMFLNEARAAGGLSHPHIVTVFDAGISDERAYIAMELLKGRDLAQLRKEGWRATPAQAALIIRRVADALAFAHSKGVIHRDVKPANIFMVGRTQPRVLDFGIARVAHQQEGDPHSGAGSPYYMAPEQVRRESTDRRADVFSLGVVLYELLTDVKPFRCESLAQIRDAVLHHEPPLANKVDPTVPKALAQIAARAMAKDPEHRFRSARSFARELRQWIDENPTSPEGERTTLAAPVPVRRPRWVVGVGLGAAAAVIVGAVAAWALHARGSAVAAEPAPVAARASTTAEPAPAMPSVVPAQPAADASLAASASGTATPTTPSTPAETPPAAAESGTLPAPSDTAPVTVPAAAEHAATKAGIEPSAPVRSAAIPKAPTLAAPAATAAAPRESAKNRRAREARERDAREAEARLAAARLLVAPATGTVKIAISPWGLVEVDGTSAGAAPPITELTLAEGRHQIVIRNGDYAPYTAQIQVTTGQTVSLRHKFGS